ncbi:MAG: hypothetical protein ACK4IU_10635 [Tabrizicola flagellatus]|uniref:hypothetical protein n=1 Tax=Tabrizicola flagellatus TaxID=2593021 RepID=UPI003918C315
MIRLALILLCIAVPVSAETARVYSGEHGSFTRLVVELPHTTEWILGRAEGGYAFATVDRKQPDYDLSNVWQRITRARAANIATDPDTGTLRLSIGCDCHIFPFEYRPGVVVLDIKPGEAPQSSAFESSFESRWMTKPAAEPAPVSTPSPKYSWLGRRAAWGPSEQTQPLPLPLATGGVSLDPLRTELLEQLARGAADGLVDLRLPVGPSGTPRRGVGDLPWSGVRIGEQPGLSVNLPGTPRSEPASASNCADETLLDIQAWGESGSPVDLLASARSGLYGEFDQIDPDAILRSVRLHLHLGFGAEAVQMAGLMSDTREAETLSLYKSMGRIIDGEPDPATPFAMMLDCDGPAALWAALARDRLPRHKGINRAAILRAFLALPPHLRNHLGTGLAERFLAVGDPDAARMVRDAMARTPNAEAQSIALLDAASDLHLGNSDSAQRHAADAVALDGNNADGLVTLVEAHFRKLQPLEAEVAETLGSFRGEIGDTARGEQVKRAIVLSLALSDQFDAAFGYQGLAEDVIADLWRVAASRADDDTFLRHAVLPADAVPPKVTQNLELDIAKRLLDLGFPDAALVWTGQVSVADPPQRRLVAAAALLRLGDARSVVQLLAGLDDPKGAAVRAQALLRLNDLPAAAAALSSAGKPDDAARVELWRGVAASADSPVPEAWRDPALTSMRLEPDATSGLLGRAASTMEASLASRTAIKALLDSVNPPAGE